MHTQARAQSRARASPHRSHNLPGADIQSNKESTFTRLFWPPSPPLRGGKASPAFAHRQRRRSSAAASVRRPSTGTRCSSRSTGGLNHSNVGRQQRERRDGAGSRGAAGGLGESGAVGSSPQVSPSHKGIQALHGTTKRGPDKAHQQPHPSWRAFHA
ncbi:unnamed protein product [Lampetra fluviatilis]